MPESVTLNVYDLCVNILGSDKGMKAFRTSLYHCAIEVYDEEWSYGCCKEGSGVFKCHPKKHPVHSFRTAVPMGTTSMSKENLNKTIRELSNSNKWQGCEYELLRHNCCHFSNDLCQRLGLEAVPVWVKSTADESANLVNPAHGIEPRDSAKSDGYVFGDISRDAAATAGRVVSSLAQTGGDVSRGVLSTVDDSVRRVLTDGNDLSKGAADKVSRSVSNLAQTGSDVSHGVLSTVDDGVRKVLSNGNDIGKGATEKVSRTVANLSQTGGDVSRGMLNAVDESARNVTRGVSSLAQAGGDVGRGLFSAVNASAQKVVSGGNKAKDESTSKGYRFGDISRGLVSNFTKK